MSSTADPDGGLTEAALVGRAQDGDVVSFETLTRRYSPAVFRLARRTLSDRGDSEDAVQDTFTAVWRRLPTLNDPFLFRAWIFQIAIRRCLNVLRTRSRHQATPTDADDLDAASDAAHARSRSGNDPAAAAVRSAQLIKLDTVLAVLAEQQRVCWVLREVNELSYAEIAYATQLPLTTVRGRIARARQQLAKGMDSWR